MKSEQSSKLQIVHRTIAGGMSQTGGSTGWWFAGALAAVVIQRLVEVGLTARHTRWIRDQGGIEFGRAHYPWMVALHAGFAVSMCLEFLILLPQRLSPLWPLYLIPLLLAQVLRYSAMAALGLLLGSTRSQPIPVSA